MLAYSLPRVGEVWDTEARGTWGEGRTVVILRVVRDRVRVRNLDTGIRTWISRDLFDNMSNLARSVDRETEVARRKRHIPAAEYARLMESAMSQANAR